MSILPDALSLPRKRSRPETEDSQTDGRPFTIRHYSEPLAPPRVFHPICILPRAQLPLAFLDTTIHGSALFTGQLRALDLHCELEGQGAAVCVAKEAKDGRLYAVERVKKSCYALCRLREHLTSAMLLKLAQPCVQQPLPRPVKRRQHDPDRQDTHRWWSSAAVDVAQLSLPPTQLAPSIPPLAMLKSPAPTILANQDSGKQSDKVVRSEASPPPLDNVGEDEKSGQPQDTLEQLAKQYLDILYLSRTPLAYFAKGPLSRARTALSSRNTDGDIGILATFLRESILTSSIMDKKYRESIPNIIKELPTAVGDKPPENAKKRRQKWKGKRSKAGFFSNEQDFLERWWRKDDLEEDGDYSAEEMDVAIRGRLAKVRNRETFMQIILVLEVLALEVALPTALDGAKAPESQQHNSTALGDNLVGSAMKPAKGKKAQHLPTQLEAMLDKLCIWYSLASNSPTKTRDGDQSSHQVEANDELKGFCVEVVIPFYSSRIPEHSAMVSKKFGGPSAPSPAKRRALPSWKSSAAEPKNAPVKTARKPLTRVSTEIINQTLAADSRRPPSLQRAATDSEKYPFVKSEGREISLTSIPAANPASGHSRRSSSIVPSLQHFSKREVDLTAVAATNEARIRRKRDVENRLKEAVEMLKKPNRALAVEENAKRVDERFVKATTKAKPRPSHSEHAQKDLRPTVLVDSTPGNARMIKATPRKPVSDIARADKSESSGSRRTHVPSSSANYRPPLPLDTPSHSRTFREERSGSGIQETPSRGFAKFMPAGLARPPGTLESPVAARASVMVQHTPCKIGGAQPFKPLLETSSNTLMRMQDSHEKSRGVSASIYDSLGWDEDVYEELS